MFKVIHNAAICLSLRLQTHMSQPSETEVLQSQPDHAIVVVMGDIGRSPRMCYHALSLAKHGFQVELVGYPGSKPHSHIVSNPNIRLVPVRTVPSLISDMFPRPLALVIKFMWLLLALLYCLLFSTQASCKLLLMQNPPGVPTMLVCYLACIVKGCAFVIDWHNYTYSILQLSNRLAAAGNQQHDYSIRTAVLQSFTGLAEWWEGYWGKKANWNLCVSKAMQQDLRKRWGIRALTVYDKAPAWIFRPLSIEKQHNFLVRLMSTPDFSSIAFSKHWLNEAKDRPSDTGCLFSYKDTEGRVQPHCKRPFLVVSSTSWTEDEDFGLLLDALKEYEKHAQAASNNSLSQPDELLLPKLLVVITGKGPQQAFYLERITKMRMQNVHIVTTWLAAEDYPKLLACADVGVSLHTSTSGLDLPIKVVDMFGCNLPVLAKRFEAIEELVMDGGTGILFDSSTELKQALVEVASGFPSHSKSLDKLKKSLSGKSTSWDEQWDAALWPVVQSLGVPAPSHEEMNRWERFQINEEEDRQLFLASE